MKIVVYCQHVLGVGHFFRTLELVKAMKGADVVLVTGGGRLEVALPAHVRHVMLPGLMMDENFSGLHTVDPEKGLDEVKKERQAQLLDLVKTEKPHLFLIELYPFGRRAFRFELVPVLDYIKTSMTPRCRVVCSLRDILVEKKDRQKYETRVIEALNSWFDAVLVHSDPQLIRLDNSFSGLDQIRAPLVYTGFVTPRPDGGRVKDLKEQMGLSGKKRLIVASAGGGNVGASLLRSVVTAFHLLSDKDGLQLKVYTGPYMDETHRAWLKDHAGPGVFIEEFHPDFVTLLGAADLSVSMAGYNTCMNIVAANIPSLVWPFAQNREQRDRALKLNRFVPMGLLEDQDLLPEPLAQRMQIQMGKKMVPGKTRLDLDGAANTFKWIQECLKP